jgi:hypothetical protein
MPEDQSGAGRRHDCLKASTILEYGFKGQASRGLFRMTRVIGGRLLTNATCPESDATSFSAQTPGK